MTAMNRREFLDRAKKTTAGLAAGVTLLANANSARAYPANDKIILAMVGVRGRGNHLAHGFLDRDDCEIGWICDVESALFDTRGPEYAQRQGKTPKFTQDFREALDDSTVDAIVVATPDHWHSTGAVWGCQAGKDVYVEKPPSHNCWEGQQMVKAARKYDRVVQVGTQNRSAPCNMAAKKFLDEGKLGTVHLCRVFNMKSQGNPQWQDDQDPPASFDWDMWNGPAPMRAYNPTIRNGGWHHRWNYSGGDFSNDGVHQMDLARWLVGVELPKAVHCTGGRFADEGAAQTPDTQIATYDYDKLTMTFELTLFTPYMLKTDRVIRDSDMYPHWPQNATRIEIYGTEGVMVVGRHGGGWQVFIRPKDRQPVVRGEMYGRFPDPEHKENFVQCIRSRQRPNADVEIGHLSALLVHYANISYRVGGEKLAIDPTTQHITNNADAQKLFKRDPRKPWAIEEEV